MNPSSASLPLMLKQLRLSEIYGAWQALADKALHEHWTPQDYLAELCHLELSKRSDKRLERYIREAQLPPGKHLSDFVFGRVEGVNEAQVRSLTIDSSWVGRGDNLLIFGASGLGKTHLATAIAYGLIQNNIRVKFMSATAIVQLLQRAKAELKLEEQLLKLDRYEALLLDDLGYVEKSSGETSVLFELIAHRYERKSLIITSNQSFEDWDQLFDNTTMTVAAIDRLVHHAKIIHCKGESYRRQALKTG